MTSSFLSYWNEDMGPINGATQFVKHEIYPKLMNCFDWNQSNPGINKYYVKSIVPEMPIIGYFTPTLNEHLFTVDEGIINSWATRSYGFAGCFSFPQMAFDANNKLHLAYLGLLDGGVDGEHWFRHPYYTTRNASGTWTSTERLVNEPVNREYAYLTLAGMDNAGNMYLMAQVDSHAGVYTAYVNNAPDHDPTMNTFCFNIGGFSPPQLCMVSVDENNHNEIVWKPLENTSAFNIYREGDVSGKYDLVGTAEPNGTNSWVDMTSDAKMRSYRYKVSAVYDSEVETILSDPHKTMHLTINAGMNNSWNLIWTAYEGTEYSTYNIYRTTGDTPGEFTLIGTMPAGNTSYSDFGAPAEGYVYYMVEIMLNAPCDVGKALASIKSNVATNNPNVGIVETLRATSLQVYPNPTNGQLTIEMGDMRCETCDIAIYDIYGRKHQVSSLKSEVSNLKIDVSHLPSGMYFLRIECGDAHFDRLNVHRVARFVKE
jgi:hypothetical protein